MRTRASSVGLSRWVATAVVLSLAALAQAFSLEEATALYRERFSKSPASVREAGDYLFVIQEGVLDDNTDNGWNRVILTGQRDAVMGYIGRSSAPVISPFGKKVTEQLSEIGSFKIPSCRVCKVEEIRYRGRYRHVSAFEALPIRKAKELAQSQTPISRTVEEWTDLIKTKLSCLPSSRERIAFWARIGATIPCLLESGGLEWRPCAADGVAVEDLLSHWAGTEDEKACVTALDTLPSFQKAHARLSEIAEKSGDSRRALTRKFRASALKPDPSGVKRIARLLDTEDSGAWGEYARLYDEVLKRSEVLSREKDPMWQYELNTFGHLGHASAGISDKESQRDFQKAKLMFSQGQDLPRILSLLSTSLMRRPDSAEKWRYYAASLRASGNLHDAVIAYHQALALDSSDTVAMQDLCLLYDRLGFSKLAKGNAWFIAATCTDVAARDKVIQKVLK